MSRISDALRGVQKVAWDTSAIVYFVESNPRAINLLTELFERNRRNETAFCGSVLLLAEVLRSMAEQPEYTAYQEAFALLRPLIVVSEAIGERAADLRRDFGLKTVDAVHIATAVENDADAFVTCDANFLRVQNAVPLGDGRTLRVLLATQF